MPRLSSKMGLWRRKNAIIGEISKEIELGIIEEENLERLEILEEILRENGCQVPESLKQAYCQVAMECTVRCLICAEDAKRSFIQAIRRIWTKRVMALCDNGSSLVTRELKDGCQRLKMALTDEKVRDTLMEYNANNKPLVSLKKLISELLHEMGSCAASANIESQDEAGETETSGNKSSASETEAKGKEIVLANELPELMPDHEQSCSPLKISNGEELDAEHSLPSTSGNRSGASEADAKGKEIVLANELPELMPDHEQPSSPLKISNGEELDAEHTLPLTKTISSPVFNRVLKDLKASKHNLVNALEQARVSNLKDENKKQKVAIANPSSQDNAPKPTLMARSSTAQTYEWEDSIDDSTGESNGDGGRANILKRKKLVESPLKRDGASKGARREKVRWTTAETLAILKGYEMHGPNWKLIKDENPILARRTNVDIKDKFRVEKRRQEACGRTAQEQE